MAKKIVNKGAESDYRASKLDKLKQAERMVRSGVSFAFDGFAQQEVRCVQCGTVRRVPKQAAFQLPAPCTHCRIVTLHERTS